MLVLARAHSIISVIPMKDADPNVRSIPTVRRIRRVSVWNAKIRVLERAVKTRSAMWLITHQLVLASSDTREIHSYSATSSSKPVRDRLKLVRVYPEDSYVILNTWLFAAVVADNVNPCQPSPCGPYSQCRASNGQAVCSCLPTYIGAPPGCRPECTVSTDCATNRACANNKCVDPCPNSCGQGTTCRVVNHSPICMCKPGFSGDPFIRCLFVPRKRNEFYIHNNFVLVQYYIFKLRKNINSLSSFF